MNKRLVSKKDYVKVIRGMMQGLILLGIVILVIKNIYVTQTYKPLTDNAAAQLDEDQGFIAISYFGVSRTGAKTVIRTERLEEQLEALYNNGYVTITQQDVMDYYQKDKKLPEKALFLMFEDGYTGTAIFAQKIMEKYNFKATMVSYGEKLTQKDSAFLDAKDLKNLEASTFWELGTNGYRLFYINVFDEQENYMGELAPLEFTTLAPTLRRKYNHYLMDYIRDEYGIPKETTIEMKKRIETDYDLLENAYKEQMGDLPKLHVLMHANTGAFGNHPKVSALNEAYIKSLFSMNYNREGYSVNDKTCDLYDLTRMQGQAYWYPNHLLMRIQDDTKEPVTFVNGDEERMQQWELLDGAAEYRGEVIALTSKSKGKGLIRLKQSESYKDYSLTATLAGNMIGSQAIYLRADATLENYLKVEVANQVLYIYECIEGEEKLIFKEEINEQKIEEDKVQLYDQASYNLEIDLDKEVLSIQLGSELTANVPIALREPGYIYLESGWNEGYSQRNIYDDVYDGVFEKLVVQDKLEEQLLYSNCYTGFEKLKEEVKNVVMKVVNWFIETL